MYKKMDLTELEPKSGVMVRLESVRVWVNKSESRNQESDPWVGSESADQRRDR